MLRQRVAEAGRFVKRILVSAYEDNVPFLASALTFNALLALIPFALLALAALGYTVQTDGDVVEEVHSLFSTLLPFHEPRADDPFTRAEDFFVGVVESRAQLSALGLPLFLWFSIQLFAAVRVALNEVFDQDKAHGCLTGFGVDFLLVTVTLVLFIANAVFSVPAFGFPWIGRWLSVFTAFGFSVAFFFVVYISAPTRPVRWQTALVAAAFASLSFEIAKRGYGVYLTQFVTIDRVISNANFIAILLLILWMYFTAFVFLLGGEVAQAYELVRRQRDQRAILA